jgi:hypothetical protein
MAITIIVEDGTGIANANSYISAADADTYFEGRLRSTDWSGASAGDKDIALAESRRVLDYQWQWNGTKTDDSNELQWPRYGVVDPDSGGGVNPWPSAYGLGEIASDEIPQWLMDAQCEIAVALLASDLLKAPDGEGLKRFELTGVMDVEFDLKTAAKVTPRHVSNTLSKYGRQLGQGGSVKLTRA